MLFDCWVGSGDCSGTYYDMAIADSLSLCVLLLSLASWVSTFYDSDNHNIDNIKEKKYRIIEFFWLFFPSISFFLSTTYSPKISIVLSCIYIVILFFYASYLLITSRVNISDTFLTIVASLVIVLQYNVFFFFVFNIIEAIFGFKTIFWLNILKFFVLFLPVVVFEENEEIKKQQEEEKEQQEEYQKSYNTFNNIFEEYEKQVREEQERQRKAQEQEEKARREKERQERQRQERERQAQEQKEREWAEFQQWKQEKEWQEWQQQAQQEKARQQQERQRQEQARREKARQDYEEYQRAYNSYRQFYEENEQQQEENEEHNYSSLADEYAAILGVSKNATKAEIKLAWRRKMKNFHPDRHVNAPPEMKERLNEEAQKINKAYEYLRENASQ